MINSVGSLWYYSSAKPGSGYSNAVCGYAHKLAVHLDMRATALAGDDEDYLLALAASDGAPSIVIGAAQSVRWAARAALPPHILKARPYQDQHGHGPSMHALTHAHIEASRQKARQLWGELPGPTAFVVLANPMWLVTDYAHWIRCLTDWLQRSGVQTLLLSDSPRTNPLVWQQIVALYESMPLSLQLIVNTSENHYLAMMAAADVIIMVGSSRTMAGEAAMCGKPVYYRADEPVSDRQFFADAEMLMGHEARRYRPLDTDVAIIFDRFEPHDVTLHYVSLAAANYMKVRSAA